MSRVINNYLAVKRDVEKTCSACGRNPDEVKLLVVSKTIPVPVLMELYDHGIREFAENREPELAMKFDAMPKDIIWHFIGPVQSNKIRKVVKLAHFIHSVDSLDRLERFERIAGEESVKPGIFLEVNVSGEESKGGMTAAELPAVAARAMQCRNLDIRGLMTMAPFEAGIAELEKVFNGLRLLKEEQENTLNCCFPDLSMGMSGDFATAIRCGATVVRVGSKIFEGIGRASQ
ncbi:MAG: YggS family pyridoxal phosphate-dependent enzyme [Lentisphaerae bacterium]|nr:YggS family pyridoxal phosphate-dependent enzyme [Lentisphaerota bacterium]